jgi:hypothetical protein
MKLCNKTNAKTFDFMAAMYFLSCSLKVEERRCSHVDTAETIRADLQ